MHKKFYCNNLIFSETGRPKKNKMLNERVVILYKSTFLLNSMHVQLCLEEHACTGLLAVGTQLKMVSREAVEVCLGFPDLPFLISFLTPCLTALHDSVPHALGGGVPPPSKTRRHLVALSYSRLVCISKWESRFILQAFAI